MLHLTRCPELKSVNFWGCEGLTDTMAKYLASCEKLQDVNLGGCRKLTDAGVEKLVQSRSLQSVNLGGCRNLTDASAVHLAVEQEILLSCRTFKKNRTGTLEDSFSAGSNPILEVLRITLQCSSFTQFAHFCIDLH